MGKVPKVDTKRNKALIKDYKSGKYTGAQLVAKYKITSQRIYEILGQYNIPKKKKL